MQKRPAADHKRKPFAYEKEQRIVKTTALHPKNSFGAPMIGELVGLVLPWDPEEHIERELIHPGADDATCEAVKAVVRKMAPALSSRLVRSRMADLPPK
jgi:hypothetical protein